MGLKDNFTTNFMLLDGSYGTLYNGNYRASDGAVANFLNGSYTSGSASGNIYGASAPPNTASLPIPTPYTSKGIGSAIAMTALEGALTYPSTAIEGTTDDAHYTPHASTLTAYVVGGQTTSSAAAPPAGVAMTSGMPMPPDMPITTGMDMSSGTVMTSGTVTWMMTAETTIASVQFKTASTIVGMTSTHATTTATSSPTASGSAVVSSAANDAGAFKLARWATAIHAAGLLWLVSYTIW